LSREHALRPGSSPLPRTNAALAKHRCRSSQPPRRRGNLVRIGSNPDPSFRARMSPSTKCGHCHVRRPCRPKRKSKRDRPEVRGLFRRACRPARRCADPPAHVAMTMQSPLSPDCGHAAALALGSDVPRTDSCSAARDAFIRSPRRRAIASSWARPNRAPLRS
jgi:hypothetical protein